MNGVWALGTCVSLCVCQSLQVFVSPSGGMGFVQMYVEEYTQNRPVTILGKKKKKNLTCD